MTVSDYKWLRMPKSDYESDWKWLQVTKSDYKWLKTSTSVIRVLYCHQKINFLIVVFLHIENREYGVCNIYMVFVCEGNRFRNSCSIIVWHQLLQWQWARFKGTLWTLRCVFSWSQCIYDIYFESVLFLAATLKWKKRSRKTCTYKFF